MASVPLGEKIAEDVLKTKEREKIRTMFDEVAPQYDFLNHVLSVGNDFYWRWRARRVAAKLLEGKSPSAVLDIATGTGDLAVAMASIPNTTVTGVDLSDKMLSVARLKAPKIVFEVGDAEALRFENEKFDLVSAGFGVRNFETLSKGLAELWRVTKKGGSLIVIEPMIPRTALVRSAYLFYFKRVLPRVARLFTDSKFAYDYLPRSVETFPQCESFLTILKSAGYSHAEYRTMTLETAILYIARK